MTPQEWLWYIPNLFGPWWWIACAIPAAIAAALMFVTAIMRHPADMLFGARMLIVAGLVSFACVPLNSGWLPWGALLSSMGALLASILIATNWCERPDKSLTVTVALWRWLVRLFHHQPEKPKELA